VQPVPQAEPGLVVYRFGASLYFANAARFEEQVNELAQPGVSWLCIGAVAIGDVDYTGCETLLELHSELESRGIRLVFAGIDEGVRQELDRAGVTAAVGSDAYFDGLDDVFRAYRASSRTGTA
jgi:MFS superfamily sulfate permease-like transporter